MKALTESKALSELKKIKEAFRAFININYEHNAKSCLTCKTQGACCLDAHFVNVHITKLEAAAVYQTLEKLSVEKQHEIYKRARETVEKYDLNSPGDSFSKTFACPLFEKGIGCLVHAEAKPVPCISHACYENQEDLPPEKFQQQTENRIERLNKRTYGNSLNWLPLPVWLDLINPFTKSRNPDGNKRESTKK